MMKKVFAAAVCIALMSGCLPKDDEQLRVLTEIRKQLEISNEQLKQSNKKLEDVNKKLVQMETEMKNLQRRGSVAATSGFQMQRADPAELAKIKLPEKPTDEQVEEYIRKIQQASMNQNSFSNSDPQVAMYTKIGQGHLNVVLPFLADNSRGTFHLRYALPKLVGKSDKDFVLKNLAQYPQLVTSVLENGWFQESRKNVTAAMENTRSFHEFEKVVSLMISTPEDQKALVRIFENNPNAGSLAARIETFPDVDLGKLAETVWKKNRFNQSTWEILPFAVFAVKNGNKEAFPFLFSQMIMQTSRGGQSYVPGYPGTSLPYLVNDLLDRDTEVKETFAWYNKNAARLVFDKKQMKYVLSEGAK